MKKLGAERIELLKNTSEEQQPQQNAI